MPVREAMSVVGSLELDYWRAWFVLRDEKRLRELEQYGLGGL